MLNPKTTQLQLKKLFKIQTSADPRFGEVAALYNSPNPSGRGFKQRADIAAYKNIDSYFDQEDYVKNRSTDSRTELEISHDESRLRDFSAAKILDEVRLLRTDVSSNKQTMSEHRLANATLMKKATLRILDRLKIPKTASTTALVRNCELKNITQEGVWSERSVHKIEKSRPQTSTTCQTKPVGLITPKNESRSKSPSASQENYTYMLMKRGNNQAKATLKVFQRPKESATSKTTDPTQSGPATNTGASQRSTSEESVARLMAKHSRTAMSSRQITPTRHVPKLQQEEKFLGSGSTFGSPRTDPRERPGFFIGAPTLRTIPSIQVNPNLDLVRPAPSARSVRVPNIKQAVTGVGFTEDQIQAIVDVFGKALQGKPKTQLINSFTDEEVLLSCANQGVNLRNLDLHQRDYIQKFFKCLYGSRSLNKMKLVKPFVYPCSFRKEDLNINRLLMNIPDGEPLGTMNIGDIWESGMRHTCLKQAGLVRIKKHLDQVANSSKTVVSLLNKNLDQFLANLAAVELNQTRVQEHSDAANLSFGRFLKNYQRYTDQIGSKTLKQSPLYQQPKVDSSGLGSPLLNNTLLQVSYSRESSIPAPPTLRQDKDTAPVRSILKQRSQLDTSQQGSGFSRILSQDFLEE